MFYSLLFSLLLQPLPFAHVGAGAKAQGGALKLTNARITVGELGPTRPSAKVLPGDVLFISYDINGLTIEDDGVAKYKMSMEVINSEGKAIFKQDPRDLADFFPLRGNSIPARAFITIGLDQDPGAYTCKLTVEDPKTKATDTLTQKFEVGKREFGIVAVYTTYDERGAISASTTGTAGQTIFIHFSVATFERDPKTKQPNVEFEFQILDESGKPTLPKPRKHTQDSKALQQVAENAGAFAMLFPLAMSRPGKFTVKITATDNTEKGAGKKAVYELPVTVLPAN